MGIDSSLAENHFHLTPRESLKSLRKGSKNIGSKTTDPGIETRGIKHAFCLVYHPLGANPWNSLVIPLVSGSAESQDSPGPRIEPL